MLEVPDKNTFLNHFKKSINITMRHYLMNYHCYLYNLAKLQCIRNVI